MEEMIKDKIKKEINSLKSRHKSSCSNIYEDGIARGLEEAIDIIKESFEKEKNNCSNCLDCSNCNYCYCCMK